MAERGALAGLDLALRTAVGPAAGVTLAELPQRVQVTLRGDPRDPVFATNAARVLGTALPLPGVAAEGRLAVALGLGPDEWLLLAPAAGPGGGAALVARLGEAVSVSHAAVVDVSSARAAIRVGGRHAADLIATGCPLDLEPPAFGPGRVASTLYANIGVILHQPGEAARYELHVARSLAVSLWQRLAEAGREFGVAIVPG